MYSKTFVKPKNGLQIQIYCYNVLVNSIKKLSTKNSCPTRNYEKKNFTNQRNIITNKISVTSWKNLQIFFTYKIKVSLKIGKINSLLTCCVCLRSFTIVVRRSTFPLSLFRISITHSSAKVCQTIMILHKTTGAKSSSYRYMHSTL